MMIGLNRPDFAWHGDMHSNLSLMLFHSYQINTAKGILDTILNIQPKEGSSMGGETREAVVNRLCQDMLNKLPADYVGFEVRRRR